MLSAVVVNDETFNLNWGGLVTPLKTQALSNESERRLSMGSSLRGTWQGIRSRQQLSRWCHALRCMLLPPGKRAAYGAPFPPAPRVMGRVGHDDRIGCSVVVGVINSTAVVIHQTERYTPPPSSPFTSSRPWR